MHRALIMYTLPHLSTTKQNMLCSWKLAPRDQGLVSDECKEFLQVSEEAKQGKLRSFAWKQGRGVRAEKVRNMKRGRVWLAGIVGYAHSLQKTEKQIIKILIKSNSEVAYAKAFIANFKYNCQPERSLTSQIKIYRIYRKGKETINCFGIETPPLERSVCRTEVTEFKITTLERSSVLSIKFVHAPNSIC